MLALVQRVSRAQVTVAGKTVGAIGRGLLVLVCAEQGDTEAQADKLLAKLLKLRIFSDAQGKLNLSVQDLDGQGTQGGLLLVSQFTLAADLGVEHYFVEQEPPYTIPRAEAMAKSARFLQTLEA